MRYEQSVNRWKFTVGDYNCNIVIPHTWNVDDDIMKHRGKAKYETTVFVSDELNGKKAFLKFNAVYHTANVFVNGKNIGTHSRSGFTPFKLDITDAVKFGDENTVCVEVDNTHIDEMLPHKDDFDWADDGGIIRRVTLEFIESDGIEYMHIDEKISSISNGLAN